MAGRPGRVVADRNADTLCEQTAAPQRGDIERIAASILKWGWTNPVLVDEQGVLIAGHGRVAAAARLGLKSIPVIALMQLKVCSMCLPWPPRCLIYLRGRRLDGLQKGRSTLFGLFPPVWVCIL
jgi:hypothetical protein